MQVGKFVGTFKIGIFGAVLAVGLAGCTELTPTGKLPDTPSSSASSGTESNAASGPVSPTTSAAPTMTYTPEEQAVVDQYKGYYEAWYLVPSYDAADIRKTFEPFAVPTAIDQVVEILQGLVNEGQRPSGTIQFGVINVVLLGETANVIECRDTSSEVFVSTSDGSEVGRGAPGTKLEVELHRIDNRWLVWESSGTDFGC